MRRRRTVVFNNPFDSFQNTVVKAKEERERLDRLLTVSTPRERLLVALIALMLCVLTAWLFLGNVAHSLAVDGVLAEPGEHAAADGTSVQALVWIDSGAAPQLRAGMPVSMELTAADGATTTVAGEIGTIAAVPLADGIAAFEAVVPVSVHRFDILLDEGVDAASLAGMACRIVIETGRRPLATLLGMRRP